MKLFDSSDVDALTGLSQEGQRDWRRRGFLDDFGIVQPNGRWKYRPGEVLRLAIAKCLIARRLCTDIHDALKLAAKASEMVWDRLVREPPLDAHGRALDQIRFVVAYGASKEGDSMQIEYFTDLNNATRLKFGAFVVIDLNALAEELRNDLAPAVTLAVAARNGGADK